MILRRVAWLLALPCALAGGCDCGGEPAGGGPHAGESPASSEPTATPDEPASDGPRAAFVIYEPARTHVVFVDRAEVVSADGLWAADPETPTRVTQRVLPSPDATEVGLPRCACGTAEGACIDRVVQRTIDVADGFDVTWADECACWASREEVAWPTIPEYPVNGYGESLAPCDETSPPSPPVSVLSGRVYTSDWGSPMNEPCARDSESSNAYDRWGGEIVLVDVETRAAALVDGPLRCGEVELEMLGGIDELRACDEDTDDWDDPCHPNAIDVTTYRLRRGELCEVSSGVSPPGIHATCMACVRVTPERCPSALDPCGPRAPYEDAIRDAEAYWIATDGSYALVGMVDVTLIARDGGAREVDALFDEVIGAAFLPDASALGAAMRHDFAVAAEPPAPVCEYADDCPSGRRCMNGECHPPCAEDADCDRVGQCGARCVDGACGPVPDGTCRDDRDCDYGFGCGEDGACFDPDAEPLEDDLEGDADEGLEGATGSSSECADDFACGGTSACVGSPPRCRAYACDEERDARGWARACSVARREADPGAAEACGCALEAARAPRVQGAVLYELGRLAEDRGEPEHAAAYYRRSLEARPGNAIVRARLDALGR